MLAGGSLFWADRRAHRPTGCSPLPGVLVRFALINIWIAICTEAMVMAHQRFE